MNSKHLTKGDPCPPLVDGKLRIYSMRFCPFAQRALLVAAAKKIPYDVVNINLTQKPEFLTDKNPESKVPILETSKGNVYESLIISDFLDENYPSGPGGDGNNDNLNNPDPWQKAIDRIWVEKFSKIVAVYYKVSNYASDVFDDGLKTILKELYDSLIPFEAELASRRTAFFRGNKPGMLDYMIWPWMERIPVLESLYGNKFDFNEAKDKLKLLSAWQEEMRKDPAVLESLITPEVHLEYLMTKRQGATNYDLLLGK